MEQFTFKSKSDVDDRAKFANDKCKLIYMMHHGDITKCLNDVKPVYDNCQTYIRNIYELIDSEIPMFALYELKKYKADNWGFTRNEYNKACDRAEKAIHEYFAL